MNDIDPTAYKAFLTLHAEYARRAEVTRSQPRPEIPPLVVTEHGTTLDRVGRRLTAFGRTQTLTQWAAEYQISRASLHSRIQKGWEPERALKTKVRR